jgi:hypothetical protein
LETSGKYRQRAIFVLKIIASGTNYKYPLSSGQAIWLCSKARGGKIVDYLTDEQRSYGDKAPVELGADLQFGPIVLWERNKCLYTWRMNA